MPAQEPSQPQTPSSLQFIPSPEYPYNPKSDTDHTDSDDYDTDSDDCTDSDKSDVVHTDSKDTKADPKHDDRDCKVPLYCFNVLIHTDLWYTGEGGDRPHDRRGGIN